MKPSEDIKTAQLRLEKYFKISSQFPNIAGALMAQVRTQRRLVERILRNHGKNLDADQKALLESVAQSVEVGEELIRWTHAMLGDVAKDAEALCEGAKMRDELDFAQKVMTHTMARRDALFATMQELVQRMKAKAA